MTLLRTFFRRERRKRLGPQQSVCHTARTTPEPALPRRSQSPCRRGPRQRQARDDPCGPGPSSWRPDGTPRSSPHVRKQRPAPQAGAQGPSGQRPARSRGAAGASPHARTQPAPETAASRAAALVSGLTARRPGAAGPGGPTGNPNPGHRVGRKLRLGRTPAPARLRRIKDTTCSGGGAPSPRGVGGGAGLHLCEGGISLMGAGLYLRGGRGRDSVSARGGSISEGGRGRDPISLAVGALSPRGRGSISAGAGRGTDSVSEGGGSISPGGRGRDPVSAGGRALSPRGEGPGPCLRGGEGAGPCLRRGRGSACLACPQ